jgi:hypothetical protein
MKESQWNKLDVVLSISLSISTALLFNFSAASLALGQDMTGGNIGNPERIQIIKQLKQYPDIPISFENPEEAPLHIELATVKEITDNEFYLITSSTIDAKKYTTFPKVNLVNNTSQRVTRFVVMVGNRETRKIHGISFYDVNIAPQGSFSVKPDDWVRPETKVRVADNGEIIRNKTGQGSVDLDSEKMWLRANAGNLVLKVALVEFENGTKWMIDRNSSW